MAERSAALKKKLTILTTVGIVIAIIALGSLAVLMHG